MTSRSMEVRPGTPGPCSHRRAVDSHTRSGPVVCFSNRQQPAGTRRVHQREHARSRAGTAGTLLTADLQDKRVRG